MTIQATATTLLPQIVHALDQALAAGRQKYSGGLQKCETILWIDETPDNHRLGLGDVEGMRGIHGRLEQVTTPKGDSIEHASAWTPDSIAVLACWRGSPTPTQRIPLSAIRMVEPSVFIS